MAIVQDLGALRSCPSFKQKAFFFYPRSLYLSSTKFLPSKILKQKNILPSEVLIAENRCRLNNELSIPAAGFHFAVGWTEERKNLPPVETVSHLALWNHSLILIIIHPSICHETDVPPDVMKSPGRPLLPTSQQGPVFARLHCVLFTPVQTWFDQREALMINDATMCLQPQQSGLVLLVYKTFECGYSCVYNLADCDSKFEKYTSVYEHVRDKEFVVCMCAQVCVCGNMFVVQHFPSMWKASPL